MSSLKSSWPQSHFLDQRMSCLGVGDGREEETGIKAGKREAHGAGGCTARVGGLSAALGSPCTIIDSLIHLALLLLRKAGCGTIPRCSNSPPSFSRMSGSVGEMAQSSSSTTITTFEHLWSSL